MMKFIRRFRGSIVAGAAATVIVPFLWKGSSDTPPALPLACRRFAPSEACYPDGSTHSVLDLRTARGELLARGDLVQTVGDEGLRSRMVFHLANSVIEETVDFIDYGGFVLQSYRLVQNGPLFAEDIDATILSSGAYVVSTKSHTTGHMQRYVGNAGLPPEVYHGIAVSVRANPPHPEREVAHIVAFAPHPRLINLELALPGTENMLLGKHGAGATQSDAKPGTAAARGLWSKLQGEFPLDGRLWIVTEHLPGFYVGPSYSAPVWRLDVVSPGWPQPR